MSKWLLRKGLTTAAMKPAMPFGVLAYKSHRLQGTVRSVVYDKMR